MTNEALGDRMKTYEAVTRTVLPRRTYTIIRVDGRAFHSYLRGCRRPYDLEFMTNMDDVAMALCKEISGTVFAYTQSDEISILVTDFATPGTQPWFGGVVNKMVSISAAIATAVLNDLRPSQGMALFDSRAFTIPDPVEVANYFIWRQRDCVRNSITMAAQAKFSSKQLHGVTTGQIQEMLFAEHGINWNDYSARYTQGCVVAKDSGLLPVTYEDRRTKTVTTTMAHRTWWDAQPAPHFTLKPNEFLANEIPGFKSGWQPDARCTIETEHDQRALPHGLCGNRDDHDPHLHDSSTLGRFWCHADQAKRLPYVAERRR